MNEKLVKVIQSCKTLEQLECAKKYSELFCAFKERERANEKSIDTTWINTVKLISDQKQIIESEQIIASEKDCQTFFDAITNSKEPSETLKNALDNYNKSNQN